MLLPVITPCGVGNVNKLPGRTIMRPYKGE